MRQPALPSPITGPRRSVCDRFAASPMFFTPDYTRPTLLAVSELRAHLTFGATAARHPARFRYPGTPGRKHMPTLGLPSRAGSHLRRERQLFLFLRHIQLRGRVCGRKARLFLPPIFFRPRPTFRGLSCKRAHGLACPLGVFFTSKASNIPRLPRTPLAGSPSPCPAPHVQPLARLNLPSVKPYLRVRRFT
jgi:hypothetical protein